MRLRTSHLKLYCYIYMAQEALVPVHSFLLLVLCLALAEACVWLAAYVTLNDTGLLYCCPFPTVVIAALVLQVMIDGLGSIVYS